MFIFFIGIVSIDKSKGNNFIVTIVGDNLLVIYKVQFILIKEI